jgi:predicted nucleotidyltransferase
MGSMPDLFEGFAVETVEDLFFTVKGLVHPPDSVIAYLRYLPDLQGDRERGGVRYRRLYHFEEQVALLEAHHPAYLRHEPSLGIRVQAVPRQRIRRVYDPRRQLAALGEQGPTDLVEEQAVDLADLLLKAANVPAESLGITGSVLFGLHKPNSDLDMIVCGEAAGRAVHGALRLLLDDPSSPVSYPDREELAALHAMHRQDTPLSATDFARLQARKVNEGRFRGRQVFIRFVKLPAEEGERYGDLCFEPLGQVVIRARVGDARDAIFTPCRYRVEDVTGLEGSLPACPREIVSYRGRFSDQARAGEWVVARGSLEVVTPQRGPVFHRLVVGGQAGDYLLSRASNEIPLSE